MSIINDALKKTHAELEKKDGMNSSKEKNIAVENTEIQETEKTPKTAVPQPVPANKQQPIPVPIPLETRTIGKKNIWVTLIIAFGLIPLIATILYSVMPSLFQNRNTPPITGANVQPITPHSTPSATNDTVSTPASASLSPQSQKTSLVPLEQKKPTQKLSQIPILNSSHTNFVLEGIMTLDDKPMALINGEIYEEGGIIEGKKIINITLKQVELRDENSKETFFLIIKK